jgi:hypothetical protein
VLPPDVPILVPGSGMPPLVHRLLLERGLLPGGLERLVHWEPGATYFAQRVYFAGEMGRPAPTAGSARAGWDTLRREVCLWQLALPRAGVQDAFAASAVAVAPQQPRLVLLVDRRDAPSRSVSNQAALEAQLRAMLRELDADADSEAGTGRRHELQVFVASEVAGGLAAQVALWERAALVVAPHGAALMLLVVMRRGAAVLEVGAGAARACVLRS